MNSYWRRSRFPAGARCSTRLILETLDERVTPAFIQWTGLAANGDWMWPGNWDGGMVPGTLDSAWFKSTGAQNPPVVSTEVSVGGILMENPWDAPITINGKLTVVGPTELTATGGSANIVGTGTLELKSGWSEWNGPNVEVKTILITGGAVIGGAIVELKSGTAQIGPDSNDGTITISGGTQTGHLRVWGNGHLLGSDIQVTSGGLLSVDSTSGDGALTNTDFLSPSTTNLKDLVNNGGKIQAAGRNLSLAGVALTQTSGTIEVGPGGSVSVGNNAVYCDGSRDYTDNVNVSGGTVRMYAGSSIFTVNGDHMYHGDAVVELRMPGYHTPAGGNLTQGVGSLSAGYVASGYGTGRSTVYFDGSAQVKFVNDTDNTWENPENGGAKLSVGGNLWMGGSTYIEARVNFGGTSGGYDYIQASGNVTLSGSSRTLKLKLNGTWEQTSYPLYNFVRSDLTGGLTAPAQAFSSISLDGNTQGWTATATGGTGINAVGVALSR